MTPNKIITNNLSSDIKITRKTIPESNLHNNNLVTKMTYSDTKETMEKEDFLTDKDFIDIEEADNKAIEIGDINFDFVECCDPKSFSNSTQSRIISLY